jgi:hypothetical protein
MKHLWDKADINCEFQDSGPLGGAAKIDQFSKIFFRTTGVRKLNAKH